MITCTECKGTGVVEFTRERGGPKCNNCNGAGYLTRELLEVIFASMLDSPSVYMGGPSQGSRRKARRLIEHLDHDWKVFE